MNQSKEKCPTLTGWARKRELMSRTITSRKTGGPEVLEFIETKIKAPGPHEVRIEVKAMGIHRALDES